MGRIQMIEIKHINKKFENFESVKDVSFKVDRGRITGLVGTNGAGKSTILRMISGIMQTDTGEILIDGELVYENPTAKGKIFHLQDKAFYLGSHSVMETAMFYQTLYPNFDIEKIVKLNEHFGLDLKKSIKKFSKGMQRQASIMLALAANTEILLMDESFDGLDPMYRTKVKKIIIDEFASRDLTIVVTSQNLFDLDGLCDCIVLLHKGNLVADKTVEEAKESAMKFQVGFEVEPTPEMLDAIDMRTMKIEGRVATFVTVGDVEQTLKLVQALNPLFVETVSLSLEEIFVIEVERFVKRTGVQFDMEEVFQVTTSTEGMVE